MLRLICPRPSSRRQRGSPMFLRAIVIATAGMFLLAACAGEVNYTGPATASQIPNAKTVPEGKSAVWAKLVPALGKDFFVINNLDKDSGLINVSYQGDPRSYVDCGRIRSYVKNARGERVYEFDAASPHKRYEVMTDGLYFIDRMMDLEGRVNIIVEEKAPKSTQITANTRYVLTKKGTISDIQGRSLQFSDTINFNTNGSASFPNPGSTEQTTCRPTGKLERSILNLVQ